MLIAYIAFFSSVILTFLLASEFFFHCSKYDRLDIYLLKAAICILTACSLYSFYVLHSFVNSDIPVLAVPAPIPAPAPAPAPIPAPAPAPASAPVDITPFISGS